MGYCNHDDDLDMCDESYRMHFEGMAEAALRFIADIPIGEEYIDALFDKDLVQELIGGCEAHIGGHSDCGYTSWIYGYVLGKHSWEEMPEEITVASKKGFLQGRKEKDEFEKLEKEKEKNQPKNEPEKMDW